MRISKQQFKLTCIKPDAAAGRTMVNFDSTELVAGNLLDFQHNHRIFTDRAVHFTPTPM